MQTNSTNNIDPEEYAKGFIIGLEVRGYGVTGSFASVLHEEATELADKILSNAGEREDALVAQIAAMNTTSTGQADRIESLEAQLAEAKALLREVGPQWVNYRSQEDNNKYLWYRAPHGWCYRRDTFLR